MCGPLSSEPHPPAIEVGVCVKELIEQLSATDALAPGERAEVVQTHISVVFLTKARAYKFKKPLRLWGLVDYGTLAARKHWCEEEVRLNRRLAPRLYLGVRELRRTQRGLRLDGQGPVVAHAVEMERLARGATWKERLQAGTLCEEAVRAGAARIATFHEAWRLDAPQRREVRPVHFARVLRQNFTGTRAHVPELFPPRTHAALATRLARRLAAARTTLRRRVGQGRAVDGHGDLRLEHVVDQAGVLSVIDCVEFTARLRYLDPLSDLSFLSMDLQVRGRPDLARALEAEYVARTQDRDAPELLPLFRAYRAHVRAKVDAQTALDDAVPQDVRTEKRRGAQRSLAAAASFARSGAPGALLVLHGLSGSGKSVLASQWAPWLGAEILRADVIRKELLGLAPTDRPQGKKQEEAYSTAMSLRTYDVVLERALRIARSGRNVFLDATYLHHRARVQVQAAAQSAALPFAILAVTCAPEQVRQRLYDRAERGDDASDANWAIYEAQARTQEPLQAQEQPFVTAVRSGTAAEESVLDLVECLERQVDARSEPLGHRETA